MFLTMFEKIWNILLTMHISDVFGNDFKQIESGSKSFEICDELLSLSEWTFWNLKSYCKTSHFLLNDAMFQQCFEKNIDLDVFDNVWKKTKHLTMFIAHP